ncbi:unnamed protein product [Cochlearia groenlandica]
MVDDSPPKGGDEDQFSINFVALTLESLRTLVTKMDTSFDLRLTKIETKLSVTQKALYLGNSTVRRIIEGVVPSTNDYDPMAAVEDNKLRLFKDYINMDEYTSFMFK